MVTLALWIPTPDTKIARLRGLSFLGGLQQLEPRKGGGSKSWDVSLIRIDRKRCSFSPKGTGLCQKSERPHQSIVLGEKNQTLGP